MLLFSYNKNGDDMSKNRLIIEMTIFTAILFVTLSLIIINEKKKDFIIPKIDQKLNLYVDENYSDIKTEIKKNKTKYNEKNSAFEMKIVNNKNKNLYFIVKYKNKKISSTYNNDYLKGKTIISYLENKLTKEIKSPIYSDINIKFIKELDKYNSSIRNNIIEEKDIKSLDIYELYVTLSVNNFDKNELISSIKKLYNNITSYEYNPKRYNITIINSNNITEEIEIKKLEKKYIINNLEEIISGIINNNNNNNLKTKFNIDFKYEK